MKTFAIPAALFAGAMLAQLPARAAEPVAQPDQPALDALDKELTEHWSDSQRGQIVYLGYYIAASVLCDELTLDNARLGKVLHEDLLADAGTLSAEDRARLDQRVIGDLAMSTGVFMGLHSHDRPQFCKRVIEERNNSKDISSLFKE